LRAYSKKRTLRRPFLLRRYGIAQAVVTTKNGGIEPPTFAFSSDVTCRVAAGWSSLKATRLFFAFSFDVTCRCAAG